MQIKNAALLATTELLENDTSLQVYFRIVHGVDRLADIVLGYEESDERPRLEISYFASKKKMFGEIVLH